MGSHDGTNYFDIGTSTDDTVVTRNTTSTVATTPLTAIQWDPGTATTSVSIPFNTYGYRNTRFIMWAERLCAANNESTIQAWVTAAKLEEF